MARYQPRHSAKSRGQERVPQPDPAEPRPGDPARGLARDRPQPRPHPGRPPRPGRTPRGLEGLERLSRRQRRAEPGLLRRHRGLAAAALSVAALVAAGLAVIAPSPSHSAAGSPAHASARRAAVAAVSKATPASPAQVASLASQLGFGPATTAQWVVQENAKPGTTAWRLAKPATSGQIEGFAGQVSAQPGDTVDLYVSTAATTFEIQAFRMGYYGGMEGRLVWDSGWIAGVVQPKCPLISATKTVSCANWSDPVAVSTQGWPPGDYLFKLTSAKGFETHVPLTLRDDTSRSAYLVDNSVTTWQAYNVFGGYDLYQGPTGPGHAGLAGRSRAVSFDRPYVLGNGGGDFVGLELPMVSMMESLGLDVSYTTDVDVSDRPQTLLQHRAYLTLGHDEYWSLSMRNGITAARDAGVNLVFLGANAAYRHIRLEPTSLGPDRLEVDYKDANADPLLGKDDADVTPWAWRNAPNNEPESLLLGEMWQCNPVSADMVITDADTWLFAGSGVQNGSHIPGVVGPEYDHFDPFAPNPGDVTVVARSPLRCGGQKEEADMTYYSAPSGAGVWDTGTIDWVGDIGPVCAACGQPNAPTRITTNVLAAFGTGPAGLAHPSAANVFRTGARPSPTTLSIPSQD